MHSSMRSSSATKRLWFWVGSGVVGLGVLFLLWKIFSSGVPTSMYIQPLSTTIDANADFGSCKEDVAAYCSGFNTGDWQTFATANGYVAASWKLGLVDCLGKNRDKTSQACDDSLDERQGLNDDVNTLCAADRGQYCQGVKPKPGSEPQVDCLKEHYDQLTAECSAALDAHEAAKPNSQQ